MKLEKHVNEWRISSVLGKRFQQLTCLLSSFLKKFPKPPDSARTPINARDLDDMACELHFEIVAARRGVTFCNDDVKCATFMANL